MIKRLFLVATSALLAVNDIHKRLSRESISGGGKK